MPPVTGLYSKGVDGGFVEEQRLALALSQRGIPVMDADINRWSWLNYFLIRRALGVLIGNASPNDGFKIVGDGSANDFIVTGGDGTVNGAGRMWVEGHQGMLLSDVRYVNVGATENQLSIYPRISFIQGVGNDILQDTSAQYTPGSLVGRTITPDVTQPATTATITANTTTDITVSIDLTVAGIVPGASYRIELSTPTADRTDGVYLDAFLDEVDSTELPDIRHNFGTLITTFHFMQVRQRVLVVQDDTPALPGGFTPLNYIDADGFEHFLVKIADIARFNGQAAINAPDVTDLRFTAGNFTNFLRKTGDNMTGDLVMQASDILLDAGRTVDGRDVSADGAILDTITFTGPGIAALLALADTPVQGQDLTGVATQQITVGEFLRAKEPGGGSVTKGVITTPPANTVRVRRADDDDDILGGTDDAQKVFGRLTESHPFPTLLGTWTFTNASFSVAGVGGSADTQLVDGDLVEGPDGLFYTVDGTPTLPNSFTIKEPFAGVTGPIIGPDARRWTLSLVMNDEGTETNYTPPGAVNIRWFYREMFGADDKPPLNPMFTIPSDQVAAELPTASETVPGKVLLAPDGSTASGRAVQGDDARLEGIQATDGVTTSVRHPLGEFEAGIGISVALVDLGDRWKITITNSIPGGGTPFPGFDTAIPVADSVAGSPGSGGLASKGDHSHSQSSVYKTRTASITAGSGASTLSVTTGFTPRAWMSVITETSGGSHLGIAIGAGGSQQGFIGAFPAGSDGGTGLVARAIGAATTWAITQFDGTAVAATRTTGSGVFATSGALGIVVGDNLPV